MIALPDAPPALELASASSPSPPTVTGDPVILPNLGEDEQQEQEMERSELDAGEPEGTQTPPSGTELPRALSNSDSDTPCLPWMGWDSSSDSGEEMWVELVTMPRTRDESWARYLEDLEIAPTMLDECWPLPPTRRRRDDLASTDEGDSEAASEWDSRGGHSPRGDARNGNEIPQGPREVGRGEEPFLGPGSWTPPVGWRHGLARPPPDLIVGV